LPWLQELRDKDQHQVKESLLELPGVGPKVADCIALFSMDQFACVPVDTHVWQLVERKYKHIIVGAKTLTRRVYDEISKYFLQRFGPKCGWALSFLFAAELPRYQHLLPDLLQSRPKPRERKRKRKELAGDVAGLPPLLPPGAPTKAGAKRVRKQLKRRKQGKQGLERGKESEWKNPSVKKVKRKIKTKGRRRKPTAKMEKFEMGQGTKKKPDADSKVHRTKRRRAKTEAESIPLSAWKKTKAAVKREIKDLVSGRDSAYSHPLALEK